MKVVFSILHYKDKEITNNCIESILSLDIPIDVTLKILVVNNPYNNENIEEFIRKKHKYNLNIEVINNNENLGFTEGNNKGFLYAKQKYLPDYLLVLNNDILIKDKFFLRKLIKINDKVDIIAPRIINLDGVDQNPFRIKKLSKLDILYLNLKINILYYVYSIPVIAKIYLTKKKLKIKLKNQIDLDNLKNIVPHGSFVIYTKNYIEKENFAFVPGPFLYGEEDLLAWFLYKNKYISLYKKELEVLHLEHMTTSKIEANTIDNYKRLFKYRKKSFFILLKKEFSLYR